MDDQVGRSSGQTHEASTSSTSTDSALPSGWFQNTDSSTGHIYFFNPSTGISQWERPAGQDTNRGSSQNAEADVKTSPASTRELGHHTSLPEPGGWFYRDALGRMQGPFQLEQLKQWRAMLPMDLLMCYSDSNDPAAVKDNGMAVELAEVLGDGELLSNWRSQCPPLEEGSAPPAPQWEEWLNATPSIAHQVAAGGNPYTEAVLAGLPNDDEDAQLARLAAQQGLSLQQLREFQLTSSSAPEPAPRQRDFSNVEFNATRDPRSGRLTVSASCDEQDNSSAALYSELRSWCDPKSLEEALQENARRRHEKLPPAVWKQLKQRKQAKKKERLKQFLLA